MNACGVTVMGADGTAQPLMDFTAVAQAGIVGLPPFQLAKFDVTAILVMAPIALATMMEHIGDMSAISATTERNFLQDPGLHRTLVGDGLGHLSVRHVRRPRQHHLRREHRCTGAVQRP